MGDTVRRLEMMTLPGLPEVTAGDDLCHLLLAALERAGLDLEDGDVLVLAQKIVSKAEGRSVDLRQVAPSARALEVAQAVDKDPRLVEVILQESSEIVRQHPGVLIVAQRLGLVMANAGVDQSNVPQGDGSERVLLLPLDPDGTALMLRHRLRQEVGTEVAVVIADSVGRAWRQGTVGLAIGCSGIEPLLDLRGQPDRQGRELRVSEQAVADELAAAASLLMGQASEGDPAVLVRGFGHRLDDAPGASALVRPRSADLFR